MKSIDIPIDVARILNSKRTTYMTASMLIENLFGYFDLESFIPIFASEKRNVRTRFTGYDNGNDAYTTTFSMNVNISPIKNHTSKTGWTSSGTTSKGFQIVKDLVFSMNGCLEQMFRHLSLSVYSSSEWDNFLSAQFLSYQYMKELLIRYYLGVCSGELEASTEVTDIISAFYLSIDLRFRDLQTDFSPALWQRFFVYRTTNVPDNEYTVPEISPILNNESIRKPVGFFVKRPPTDEEKRERVFDAFCEKIKPQVEMIAAPVRYAVMNPVSHSGRVADLSVNLGMMTNYPICFIFSRLCLLLGETTSLCHSQFSKEWGVLVSQIEWKKI